MGLATRKRAFVAVALGAALMSAGGLAAATLVKSPAQAAAESKAPKPSILTAAVEKRVLTDALVTRGTASATTQIQVTPVAATAEGVAAQLVSALHTSVGKTVEAGDVLLDISGRPLIALHGTVPAFRDLKPNDDGDDVSELQQALADLGYSSSGDRKGHFGDATKDAVKRFYTHLGYDVPTTGGPNDDGDRDKLLGAQNAVDTAQHALDDFDRVQAALRVQATATPTPTATATDNGQVPASVQRDRLKKTLDQAKNAQALLFATTGTMFPLSEAVFVPAFPAQVTQLPVKIGDKVTGPVLTLSAGQLGVTAHVTPDQGRLLKPGMKVDIIAEALGKEATGSVSSVGAVTTDTTPPGTLQAGGSGGAVQPGAAGPSYVPVVISPSTALDAQTWSGQDVRVTITSAATSGPVLVVPLSAISAGADGKTTVSKLGADGQTVTRVEVRAGISGAGFVEIGPVAVGSIVEGDRVVVAQ